MTVIFYATQSPTLRIPARRRLPPRHRRRPAAIAARGFTLIEVLVVVLIIGIVLSFVSLSINTNSAAQRLDREARRLAALAQTAATDAILYGSEIGIDITPKGYRFVHLTDEGWQVLGGPDQPLRPRDLGLGLALVNVTVDDPNRPMLQPQADGDGDGEDEDSEEDGDIRRRPEALFLSSGEIIPFVLELHAEGVTQRYQLTGEADGSIELEQIGDQTP